MPARRRRATAEPYSARPWLAAYSDGVPADLEVPDAPLTLLLDEAATAFPAAVAVSFGGTAITWRQLRTSVDRFAAVLHRLGVASGGRVALLLPGCPQQVIATFAAFRLGAVVVSLDPALAAPRIAASLRRSGARLVIADDRAGGALAVATRGGGTAVEHIIATTEADYLPPLDRLLSRLPWHQSAAARTTERTAAGSLSFVALLRAERSGAEQAPVRGDAPALAGDDGATAGPALTHRALLAGALQWRAWLTGARPGAELVGSRLPPWTATGLISGLGLAGALAAELVLQPEEPERAGSVRGRGRVATLVLSAGEAGDAGVALAPGARLVTAYGPPSHPPTHAGDGPPLASGAALLPLPGTDALLLVPGGGSVVQEIGEVGELVVRGPQLPGPGSTIPGHGDGWHRTGDLATMTLEGFFEVLGAATTATPATASTSASTSRRSTPRRRAATARVGEAP